MNRIGNWIVLALCLAALCAAQAGAQTLTGTADGYGGPITAEVTVDDGRITGLQLTGEKETPGIGADALKPLAEAILAAGTLDGVDGVAGASWTSRGVFEAVRAALGVSAPEAAEAAPEASAAGLNHGLAIVSTPRLGPGKDDKDVPVYSFNEVIAYVVTDGDGRIVDLQTDILEIITPNHDGAEDNALAGWPGASYNEDADGDGAVEGVMEQTADSFVANLPAFCTKRQLGDAYKMNSGTWTQEMDAYQSVFRGMTREELEAWFAERCSDVNGRALHGASKNEADIAKWEALSEAARAEMDAISGATMSLSDAHGDILGAIVKALENQTPVADGRDVERLGLGVVVTPRLGPGKDDQEMPVYSFNVVAAGSCFDGDGRIVASRGDILEIITPNHDGAEDNALAGWPGQSWNEDADGDGVVEGTVTETEKSFVERVQAFRTKRDLGTLYKMNSGTWTQEMDVFEVFFTGRTAAELRAFFERQCSDANGRVIRATATSEADRAKWNALTPEEQAAVDALSGATMSLSDAHGDILGAVEASWTAARPSVIRTTE